jgi:hypothetical protein
MISTKIVATDGKRPIKLPNELPTTLSHVLVKFGKALRLLGIIIDKDWNCVMTTGNKRKMATVKRTAKKA